MQTNELLDDFSVSEFGRFRFAPASLEPVYHFELGVPIDFRSSEVGRADFKRFKEILHLEAVGHPERSVSIALANLDHEVNPADWLAIELAEQQAEVTKKSESLGPEGVICECLATYADGTVRKMRTVKDGKRLFIISASATETAWDSFKKHAAISLASFHLLNPEIAAWAEHATTAYFDPEKKISFQYPASWKMNRYEKAGETVVRLTQRHNQVEVGEIVAHYATESSSVTPYTLAESHSLRSRSRGFEVAGSPLITLPEEEQSKEGFLYEPELRLDSTRFVSPCVIFRARKSLVLFGLVGPTQKDSPEWWAINKRAFEFAHQSLQFGSERS